MLNIDIIEHCNFKCYFCGAKDLTSRSYMDVNLYKSIIDQAVSLGITSVTLTPLLGEPFLHPNIYEILEYSVERLRMVNFATNASAIDVDKLSRINDDHLRMEISQYGRTEDEFVKLTNASPRMYHTVNQKITELTNADVKFHIRMREIDHLFNTDDTKDSFPLHDINVKCKSHMLPQIFTNGDIAFCRFIRDSRPGSGWKTNAAFANLTTTSLADALSDPMRYKFFDSQSICAAFCRSSYCSDGFTAALPAYKMMSQAKQKYYMIQEQIDDRYAKFEQECTLPAGEVA